MQARKILHAIAVVTVILIAGLPALAAEAKSFDAIYVFGDSYCDVGNLFAADGGTYPPAPYFNGRFSNGPLWVEHLAGTYGLPITASIAGGTDYAFGGAEVLNAVPLGAGAIPSVPQQIDLYLSQHHYKADRNALYIIEGGGNDILDAAGGNPDQLGNEIGNELLRSIRELKLAGARFLFVPRLFDVGLLPAAKAEGITAFASAATAAVNRTLDDGLCFESFDDHGHLYRIDTFSLLNSIIEDTTHYGFVDVTTPCLDRSVSPVTLCANPFTNYFWDTVHPTTFGHAFFAVLAEQVLKADLGRH